MPAAALGDGAGRYLQLKHLHSRCIRPGAAQSLGLDLPPAWSKADATVIPRKLRALSTRRSELPKQDKQTSQPGKNIRTQRAHMKPQNLRHPPSAVQHHSCATDHSHANARASAHSSQHAAVLPHAAPPLPSSAIRLTAPRKSCCRRTAGRSWRQRGPSAGQPAHAALPPHAPQTGWGPAVAPPCAWTCGAWTRRRPAGRGQARRQHVCLAAPQGRLRRQWVGTCQTGHPAAVALRKGQAPAYHASPPASLVDSPPLSNGKPQGAPVPPACPPCGWQ